MHQFSRYARAYHFNAAELVICSECASNALNNDLLALIATRLEAEAQRYFALITEFLHLDIAGSSQAVLIYTITGLHLLLLVVAMLFIALMAFRALAGSFDSRSHDGVTAAALFWYAMVVVYVLIWITIYVTK